MDLIKLPKFGTQKESPEGSSGGTALIKLPKFNATMPLPAAAPAPSPGVGGTYSDPASAVKDIMYRLGVIESSNRYDIQGPVTKSGNRALGKYQVMENNLPEWSQRYLGRKVSKEEFLLNPDLQERLVSARIAERYKTYGNAEDVASEWFSGRPYKANTSKDVTGTSVPQYVENFRNAGSGDYFKKASGQQFDVIGPKGQVYPYFPESGYGASFKLDPFTGRPLLQRATSAENAAPMTLEDRVATTFDPTKAQPLTREMLSNGRLPVEASDKIRKELGMDASQQLDHVISLQLSGSNVRSNLAPVKETAKGHQPLVAYENEVGRKVITGEISAIEGARRLAAIKGITLKDKEDLPKVEHPKDDTPIALRLFPTLMESLAELQVDPLSLGKNPKKDWWNDIPDRVGKAYAEGVVNSVKNAEEAIAQYIVDHDIAVRDFNDARKAGLSTKGIGAKNLGSFLKSGASTVGALLSPITSLFAGANEVPAIGTFSKLVTLPFAAAGDAGHDAARGIVEPLNLPQDAKDRLVDGVGEVLALAGQIAIGGALDRVGKIGEAKINLSLKDRLTSKIIDRSGLTKGSDLVNKYGLDDPKKLAELEKKYGPTDTATIVDKAKEIANADKQLKPGEVALPKFSETPEGMLRKMEVAKADWEQNLKPAIDEGRAVIVGADNIKDIFKDYAPENHPIYSAAAKDNFRRVLADPKAPEKVVFTAGGPGSGKTEAIVSRLTKEKVIIFDSTLKTLKTARANIKLAEDAGKKVEIHAVLADPVTAKRFTMVRGAETGRMVPQDYFTEAHSSYNKTLQGLIKDGYKVLVKDARGAESVADLVNRPFVRSDKALATLKKAWYTRDEIHNLTKDVELSKKPKTEKPGAKVDVRGRKRSDVNVRLSGKGGADRSETIKGGSTGRVPEADSGTKGVKTERQKFESRVYARMKAEHPELLRDEATYAKKSIAGEIKKAVDLIENDRQKAYRIAMGAEESPNVLSNAVNIALREKALRDGNTALYGQLVKKGSFELTRHGQEIVSEKAAITDNSTSRYVREIIRDRLDKLGKKYLDDVKLKKNAPRAAKGMEIIDREVVKAQKRIGSTKELDLAEAQKLIDSLMCK